MEYTKEFVKGVLEFLPEIFNIRMLKEQQIRKSFVFLMKARQEKLISRLVYKNKVFYKKQIGI